MLSNLFTIFPIPAFQDNYIWLITRHDSPYAVIVDPGDAQPVLAILAAKQLQLAAILVTHHHPDHCGGVAALLHHHPAPVFGPAAETVAGVNHPVSKVDRVTIASMGLEFVVLDIPGHTLGHIAFFGQNCLFSGDTLFTGGCGRVFEGTTQQMYESLSQLAHLPDKTLIYCGHEYTLANLKFANLVEPDNLILRERLQQVTQLRAQSLPTIPATLQLEKQTNPFLRCDLPSVKTAAEHYAGRKLYQPVEVFSVIRAWKNDTAI
jgi:hydroxyacylglutathione hydrolase